MAWILLALLAATQREELRDALGFLLFPYLTCLDLIMLSAFPVGFGDCSYLPERRRNYISAQTGVKENKNPEVRSQKLLCSIPVYI